MRGPRVGIAESVEARARAGEDMFSVFPPPFDVASDMVIVGGMCQIGPLHRVFPGVPFLSLGGRGLLVAWFAQIHELRSGPGREITLNALQDPTNFPYQELNVAVMLRTWEFFVPGIYATSDLTLRLGHRYGMPKQRAAMAYQTTGKRVHSRVRLGRAESWMTSRAFGRGRALGALLGRTFPWWSPRVRFPTGSWIEGLIEDAPRARPAWVAGSLALDEPWLPRPVALWRLGLHLPEQRMQLPSPIRAQAPR